MNWKAEAMERLRQYDAVRCALEALTEEIRRVEDLLCTPGGARLDVKVNATQSHEDWVLGQMVSLQELRQRQSQTERWLHATDQALSALTPEEKLVLHRLYIQPHKNNLDRLSQELNAERSSVYRRRDAALRRFTTALYGPM